VVVVVVVVVVVKQLGWKIIKFGATAGDGDVDQQTNLKHKYTLDISLGEIILWINARHPTTNTLNTLCGILLHKNMASIRVEKQKQYCTDS
jgi:hypothetical protein